MESSRTCLWYGSSWSEVAAYDILAEFERDGVTLDSPEGTARFAELGRKYRREILEPGASKSGADMIRGFLGRDSTSDAFFREVVGSA